MTDTVKSLLAFQWATLPMLSRDKQTDGTVVEVLQCKDGTKLKATLEPVTESQYRLVRVEPWTATPAKAVRKAAVDVSQYA